jgi:hypothetical protein
VNCAVATLLFALLAGPALAEDVSSFPYKHPELDRTPPTVPETVDLDEGEGRIPQDFSASPPEPGGKSSA